MQLPLGKPLTQQVEQACSVAAGQVWHREMGARGWTSEGPAEAVSPFPRKICVSQEVDSQIPRGVPGLWTRLRALLV